MGAAMLPDQIAVALAVRLALLATAAGLLRRGRWRLCLGFVAYLLIVTASNLAVVTWPERFYKPWFWIGMHSAFEVARLWIALEIAYRTFGGRSGERTPARQRGLLVVGLAAALVMTAARLDGYGLVFAMGSPWRWFSGPLCVMLATLAVARAYHVTLHPFHAALLKSFAAYMVAFDVVARGLRLAVNWPVGEFVATVAEPFAYLALACWWVCAAWRRQSSPTPPNPGRLPVAATDPDPPSGPAGLRPQLALP
jgi:hypothetical protein